MKRGGRIQAGIRIEEAKREQLALAERVSRRGSISSTKVGRVAGVDASVTVDGSRLIGVICVLSWPELDLLDAVVATADAAFPYIPGYLSFREAPVLLKAAEQLRDTPDVVLVDGQGIAHPRRLGLASHLGVLTGWRTVGCAKSRLIGQADEPGLERGQRQKLMQDGERIGTVLRTRRDVRPVWVSVGHRLDLRSAEEWVLRSAPRYRLPEPIRCAHKHASEARARLAGSQKDASSTRGR